MNRLASFVLGIGISLFLFLTYQHFFFQGIDRAMGFYNGQLDMAKRFCPKYVEHMLDTEVPKKK